MSTLTQQNLIDAIDWNKPWDELSWDEKADFLNLIGLGFLNKEVEPKVMTKYEYLQRIVDDRGTDKLSLYL